MTKYAQTTLDNTKAVLAMASNASRLAARDARLKHAPLTDSSAAQASALTGIAHVLIDGGLPEAQAIKVDRARAIAALDPEGLSGDEMRDEISRICCMDGELVAAEADRLEGKPVAKAA